MVTKTHLCCEIFRVLGTDLSKKDGWKFGRNVAAPVGGQPLCPHCWLV